MKIFLYKGELVLMWFRRESRVRGRLLGISNMSERLTLGVRRVMVYVIPQIANYHN